MQKHSSRRERRGLIRSDLLCSVCEVTDCWLLTFKRIKLKS